MNRLLLLPFLAWASFTYAQTISTLSMEPNNVLAETLNDGRFLTTGLTGGFHANIDNFHGTLMRMAGLWAGGKSPDGTLHLSASGLNISEFTPGIFDPETAAPANLLQHNIWKVTKEEILAHQADFADNGVIDNPLQGVFGWPGRGNPHFQSFNIGEMLPDAGNQDLAGFFDYDSDGIYNPANGDHPALEMSGCPSNMVPDVMAWMAFHDDYQHLLSGAQPLKMEVQATMFAFHCAENAPLGNTIFLRLKLFYWGNEPLSNTYFGLFNDYQVGDGYHEYAGCDPSRKLLFGYNGLAQESSNPAVGVKLLRGPVTEGNMEVPLHSAIMIDPMSPLSQLGYYRLLSGKNPNGSMAYYGGFTYPGSPVSSDDSTEISAGNMPGNRAAVASYGPFLLEPGAVHEMIAAYTFTKSTDQNGFAPNVKPLYSFADRIAMFYYNCFETKPELELCVSETLQTNTDSPDALDLLAFPNPAVSKFSIESQGTFISRVTVSDFTGRKLIDLEPAKGENSTLVHVDGSRLHAGIYLVTVIGTDDRMKTLKMVIER